MILTLQRGAPRGKWTPGVLTINGQHECFTCEDLVRPVKIPGETAIPAGIYRVIIDWSNRFQRDMPLIVDVPGFTGIRIHAGNTERDTDGCVLVGLTTTDTGVMYSVKAFESLYRKIQQELSSPFGGVRIEVKDYVPPMGNVS